MEYITLLLVLGAIGCAVIFIGIVSNRNKSIPRLENWEGAKFKKGDKVRVINPSLNVSLKDKVTIQYISLRNPVCYIVTYKGEGIGIEENNLIRV